METAGVFRNFAMNMLQESFDTADFSIEEYKKGILAYQNELALKMELLVLRSVAQQKNTSSISRIITGRPFENSYQCGHFSRSCGTIITV